MKIAEKIFITLSLLGIFMKFMNIPGGSILFLLSTFFFSLLYLFGLFFILVNKQEVFVAEKETHEESNLTLEQPSKKRVYTTAQLVISIFSGFFFSTLLFGLLFKIQRYPGAPIMLISGVFLMSLSVIAGVILLFKTKDTFSKGFLTRSLILLFLGASLYLVSSKTLIEIQYRNEPELKAIQLEMLENPNCVECNQKLQDYEYRRGGH